MHMALHACMTCYASPDTEYLLEGCSDGHLPHVQGMILWSGVRSYFVRFWGVCLAVGDLLLRC